MPLPTSLVVKNGSKIRGKCSGAMPVPVSVTVRQTNSPAPASGMRVGVRGVEAGRVRGDEQLAAAGHGVAGVDGEVDEHLLDHAGIGLDEGQLGGVTALQVDVLADDPLEHLGQVRDHFVQHQRLGLHDLLAAEGEQLAGQVGRAFGGGRDLLQAFVGLRRCAGPRPSAAVRRCRG